MLLSCLVVVAALIKEKSLASPAVLFPLVWTLILFVHSWQLFEIAIVNDNVLTIVLVGVLSFAIGSFVANYVRVTLTTKVDNISSKVLNLVAIKWLCGAFFAIMTVPTINAIVSLMSGSSLYNVRYTLQKTILGEGVIAILFNYYCEPFLVCLIVVAVADVFSRKRHIWIMITTIVGIFVITIVTGGRFFILYFVCSLLLCYLIFRKRIVDSRIHNKKLFKRIRFLIVFASAMIILVSIVRGSIIGRTLYVYSSGGLTYLSILMEVYKDAGRTYGALTLYGFFRPMFVVLRKLGVVDFPLFLTNAEDVFLFADQPYYLAKDIVFNSFTTCYFAPFLDGGIFGVVIAFALIGYISQRAYKDIRIDYSYSVTRYLLWGLVILLSFFRLLFTHYPFALSFVYLIMVFKNDRKMNYQNEQ